MSERNWRTLCGTADGPATPTVLTAGMVSAQLDGSGLRAIRYAGTEVVRGISFLIRNQNWGTAAVRLTDASLINEEGTMRLRVHGQGEGEAAALSYDLTIEVSASGRVHCAVSGVASADYLTNRTGFIVLHPLDGFVGRPATILHTDGRTSMLTVPERISADQPAFDIRAITHEPIPGVRVTVTMLGDAYEMEDQRNWTDASFKTYIRPLSKPFPYTIAKGERFEQSVTVEISGTAQGSNAAVPGRCVAIGDVIGTVPRTGLGYDAGDHAATLAALPMLAGLGVTDLIARHDRTLGAGRAELAAIEQVRAGLGVDVTLECIVAGRDAQAEVQAIATDASAAALDLHSIMIVPIRDLKTRKSNTLPAGEVAAADLAAAARTAFPGVAVGGGMVTQFTELNRNPPPPGLAFISHVTCATIHAADDHSVMETLEALPSVFQSAKALAHGAAYRVGPSAIGLRENPYGASVAANPDSVRCTMARAEPRHGALFGAAFTLAYAAHATAHGVSLLTLAHGAGDFGVVSPKGAARPLLHVIRGLARCAERPARAVASPAPVAALAVDTAAGRELWLANTRLDPVTLTLPAAGHGCVLDAQAAGAAASDITFLDRLSPVGPTLSLDSYAVARILLPA